MINRYKRVLTTVEEDFRKIGLLPPLNENNLSEMDDPSEPRDIPSPDPSTLDGLPDSEKAAHTKSSRQPKPPMGPDEDDSDVMDPVEDGGSAGAQKSKGAYKAVPHGKVASIKGESKGYLQAKKGVGPKGKGKNKGSDPKLATGLKPVKKLAGMGKKKMESVGRISKAASLIEEVEGLLRGVQISEEIDNLMRGFRLVSEDAALLADRLTEMSDVYEVDSVVSEMEQLSMAAAEAIDIVESELSGVGNDEDEAAATKNSRADKYEDSEDMDEKDEEAVKDHDSDKPYDVPSPAFKEQAEKVFQAMVRKLMDALEMYDAALDEQGYDESMLGTAGGAALGSLAGPVGAALGGALGGEFESDDDEDDDEHQHAHSHDHGHEEDEDDDDSEEPAVDTAPEDDDDDSGDTHVHVHNHSDVHHHHHAAADDDSDGDDDDGEMSADDNDPDHDGDDDSSAEGDTDGDRQDLMAKMHALRTKRDSMMGGHKAPFRGGEGEAQ